MLCMKFLILIAEQTRRELTDFTAEFYMKRLTEYGLKDACEALAKLAESAKTFPTLAEIKEKMGVGDVSEEAKSREIAARILSGIKRFGSIFGSGAETLPARERKMKEIFDYLGPVGWKVVEMQGGWNYLTDIVAPNNSGQLQAQWRELAKSMFEKARYGVDLDLPPGLPESSVKKLESSKQDNVTRQCNQVLLNDAQSQLSELKKRKEKQDEARQRIAEKYK